MRDDNDKMEERENYNTSYEKITLKEVYIMRNLLQRIKGFYYVQAIRFCEWRANSAFEKQNVYPYMRWEKLGCDYCNKFVAMR